MGIKRKRVVIVDDSRTMQALLDQILSVRLGFDIVGIAGDAETGLSLVEELKPDIVTIDFQMPYINGRDLLAGLADHPAVHKVVISDHAFGNIALKANLEQLGADACLSKSDMSLDPLSFCKKLLSVVAISKTPAPIEVPAAAAVARRSSDNEHSGPTVVRFPIPDDEERRLQALRKLDLANDNSDHQLDLLTSHLVQTTGFSACAITFIDRRTQWIKSATGLDRGSTTRAEAFCAYTICGDDAFIVPDAKLDERFKSYEVVSSGPMIRSYVGMPIVSSTGVRLGALCLIDTRPRRISPMELVNLRNIARIAAELIETRVAPARYAA